MQKDSNKGILSVDAQILRSLSIVINYTDNNSKSTIISEGDMINITYLESGKSKLIEATGRVKSINTYYKNTISCARDSEANINNFNIELDCSKVAHADLRTIQVVNIRDINTLIEDDSNDSDIIIPEN